jgi:hypothetical protein
MAGNSSRFILEQETRPFFLRLPVYLQMLDFSTKYTSKQAKLLWLPATVTLIVSYVNCAALRGTVELLEEVRTRSGMQSVPTKSTGVCSCNEVTASHN